MKRWGGGDSLESLGGGSSSKSTNKKIGISRREALTVEGGTFSRLVALALLGGLELIMRCNSPCLIGLDLGGPGRNTLLVSWKKLLSSSHVLSGSNTMNDNARGTEVNSNPIICGQF